MNLQETPLSLHPLLMHLISKSDLVSSSTLLWCISYFSCREKRHEGHTRHASKTALRREERTERKRREYTFSLFRGQKYCCHNRTTVFMIAINDVSSSKLFLWKEKWFWLLVSHKRLEQRSLETKSSGLNTIFRKSKTRGLNEFFLTLRFYDSNKKRPALSLQESKRSYCFRMEMKAEEREESQELRKGYKQRIGKDRR